MSKQRARHKRETRRRAEREQRLRTAIDRLPMAVWPNAEVKLDGDQVVVKRGDGAVFRSINVEHNVARGSPRAMVRSKPPLDELFARELITSSEFGFADRMRRSWHLMNASKLKSVDLNRTSPGTGDMSQAAWDALRFWSVAIKPLDDEHRRFFEAIIVMDTPAGTAAVSIGHQRRQGVEILRRCIATMRNRLQWGESARIKARGAATCPSRCGSRSLSRNSPAGSTG